MEFSEKLIQLRKSKNMTQEELAEELYVSRAAVSKWEQGRGLPSIDSLKAIATLFGVTVDALLSGEELLTVARSEAESKEQKLRASLFGLIDVLHLLFFVLPLFGNGTGVSLGVLSLASWTRTLYLMLFAATALFGAVEILLQSRADGTLHRRLSLISTVLTPLAASLAVLNRQAYVAFFALWIMAVKGFLILKQR